MIAGMGSNPCDPEWKISDDGHWMDGWMDTILKCTELSDFSKGAEEAVYDFCVVSFIEQTCILLSKQYFDFSCTL